MIGYMRKKRALLALAIVLVALNLRPAVTTFGPLLPEVRAALGIDPAVAGLLTAVPSLCFAVFGLLAPLIARRFGLMPVVAGGMGLLAAGLAIRAAMPSATLFLLFTVLALGGIAVSNVLMPAIISRGFPDRIGTLTGAYSMALTAGSAIAAALAVPVTSVLGGSWRLGLGVWAVAAVVALLCALACRVPRPAETASVTRGIHRSPTARAMAIYFGAMATAAYTVMGWLPQLFQDAGVSAAESGVLLAVAMSVAVPVSFVMPALAARLGDQRILVAGLTASGLVAYAGLAFAPAAAPWLWAVLNGLAGASFPLALTMISLRARTHEGVARLSSFAQSLGYLLSVPGPIIFGALYEHGRYASLAFMAALLVPQLLAGLRVGRPLYIEDELESPSGDDAGGAAQETVAVKRA